VRAAAIRDLETQARLLDAMGLSPEALVIIHVGGSAGGIGAGRDRFLAGFERLSEPARARLAIENDDRAYDAHTVTEIGEACGIPVVWDFLHHRCHNPQRIPADEALAAALATWRLGVMPKIHYSSSRLDVTERRRRRGRRVDRQLVLPPLRAHADLIDPIGFERFLRDSFASGDFDIMIEAKAKDLALIRLRDQLQDQGIGWRSGQIMVSTPGRRQGIADRDPKPSGRRPPRDE
jgi:UV DNA damage endonuclease